MSGAIPLPLCSAALARPGHPAVVHGDRQWTWRALCAQSLRRATWLSDRGLGPDDVIALSGAPSAEFLIAVHAIGALGATALPLPARIAPDERLRLLRTAGASALLSDAPTSLADEELPIWPLTLDHGQEALAERPWPWHERRLLIATSGSTGPARLVALTTAQIALSAFGSAMRLGHHLDDRWLCCLPLHHVGGLSIALRAAFAATTVVLHSAFDAAAVAEALRGQSITALSLVPTLLGRLLDCWEGAPPPPALRLVLVGGGPISPALLSRARAAGWPVVQTWGMTEAASQVATDVPGAPAGPGVGPALPFARVEADGARLVVRGPLVAGGSLRTGDLGSVTPQGRVIVDGRADRMYVCGGENRSLVDLEARLARHPDVREVAAVALQDGLWGQIAGALVTTDGPTLARAPMDAWTNAHLRPHRLGVWRQVATLPRTELGKPCAASIRAALGVQRDQAVFPDRGDEVGGQIGGGEADPVDGGVHHLDPHPVPTVGADDAVVEGHRAPPDAADGHVNRQVLREAQRLQIVRLGVDDRQGHGGRLDQRPEVQSDAVHPGFEGAVAEVERAGEVDDAGCVDVGQIDHEGVLERHSGLHEGVGGSAPAEGTTR